MSRTIQQIEQEREQLRTLLSSIPSTKPKAIEQTKYRLEKVEEELRRTRAWLRTKARKNTTDGGPSWLLLGFLAVVAFLMATAAILLNTNQI